MILNPTVSEWLNLILRWVHVFAGIMWIGTTYYFTWLDARLRETEAELDRSGGPAQVWMVHSGGFYVVEKRKVPDLLSRKLHWFRWEAATTWLSGMLLMILIYYLGGGVLVDRDVSNISVGAAVAVGMGLLVIAWFVYDLMMISPLGKREQLFAAIAYVLVAGSTYGLSRVFSGRATYIHVGAMFGTIMAANVWLRILPAQRRMIAAIKEGRQPNQALAAQAKLRSKQNTFMAVPVVFIMISNHFPGSATDGYNWVNLAVLILAGWAAAKFIRRA